jgi:hypothetical protein
MNERFLLGVSLLSASVVVFFAILKYGIWALLLGIALVVAGLILMAIDEPHGPHKSGDKGQSSDASASAYGFGHPSLPSSPSNSKGAHDHEDHSGGTADGSGGD